MDEERIKHELRPIFATRTPRRKTKQNTPWIAIVCSLISALIVQGINLTFDHRHNLNKEAPKVLFVTKEPSSTISWSKVPAKKKSIIRAELFSLFPVIFKRKNGVSKWAPIQDFLRNHYNVSHSNVRDIFRTTYGNWTSFEAQALIDKPYIKNYLSTVPKKRLIMAWGEKIPDDKYGAWVEMVKRSIEPTVGTLKADLFANEMLKY